MGHLCVAAGVIHGRFGRQIGVSETTRRLLDDLWEFLRGVSSSDHSGDQPRAVASELGARISGAAARPAGAVTRGKPDRLLASPALVRTALFALVNEVEELLIELLEGCDSHGCIDASSTRYLR